MNLQSASEIQYVFVRFENAPTAKNYVVFKEQGETEAMGTSKTPMIMNILGSIEILEPVDSKGGLYRAMVKKSLSNVEVGGKIYA